MTQCESVATPVGRTMQYTVLPVDAYGLRSADGILRVNERMPQDEVVQQLSLAEWLEMSARDTERQHRPLLVSQQSGNDGVQWSLAPLDGIWMASLHHEPGTAIVQQHAALPGSDSAAKVIKD